MTDPLPPTIVAPEIVRLFPTFVWKARLAEDVRAAVNADILRALERLLPRMRGEFAAGEVWQSPHALHKLPELQRLAASIHEGASAVLDFLKIGQQSLRITGCWANVAAPGGVHPMHSHPNNFLSGVYYLQVQAGADTINLHDPRPQTAIIRPPVTELTAYNTDQVVVKVDAGTLLLFPSWLPHSVSPNGSGKQRISVSFNMMFPGFAEQMSKPLWGEQ